MRVDPFSDAFEFLARSALSGVFIALVLISLAVAAASLYRDKRQRSIRHLLTYGLRFFMGCMWWQQTLWKLPPTYTDLPDGSGGLAYWVSKMVQGAAFSLQSDFVQHVVQPNFRLFAPVVYAIEVLIGVSLMLGLFTRLSGLLGALMAINLWLGLYRTPAEWPWTYFFLIVVQLMFALRPPGRSLGIDVLMLRGRKHASDAGGWGLRLLGLAT